MHVLALVVDLHLPVSGSLKEKRRALRPLLDGLRNRYPVSVAETDHQETWQRAEVSVAVVSASARQVTEVMDQVERFLWSFPELEVLQSRRVWLEED